MLETKEMKRLEFKVAETHTAVCPTCGKQSTFTLAGTQQWPARVAKAMGLPEVINVWQCHSCDTTLLEPNLQFED